MIIPFQRQPPANDEQMMRGEAFCIACDHTWQGVALTGTVHLECPSCRTMKGRFRFECMPGPGQLVSECACGNQLFYLTPDGHLCANCGVYRRY